MLLVFDNLIAERTLDCSRCRSRVDMINTCCICVFSETQLFECHGLSCFSGSANCTRTTHPKASSTNDVRGVDNELWKTLAVTTYVSTSFLLGFGEHMMFSIWLFTFHVSVWLLLQNNADTSCPFFATCHNLMHRSVRSFRSSVSVNSSRVLQWRSPRQPLRGLWLTPLQLRQQF